MRVGASRDLSVDAFAVIVNDELHTDPADVDEAVSEAPTLRGAIHPDPGEILA
jgi:hypothetical protein